MQGKDIAQSEHKSARSEPARYPGIVPVAERIRLGNLGLSVLEELALDRTAITTARMGAARTLVEVGGYLDKNRAALADVELATKSPAELRRMVAAIDVALADKAIVTPSKPVTIEQELDIVERSSP